MAINLLDQNTINQIAAGEVVERPASVVKELVENSIDAGADAITVEIKDGGIALIRVTDNGCGIPKDDVKLAFLRHSTSKIKDAADLVSISSLGFRGEALSSISAVSFVELITKTSDELCGIRYVIEGGEEKAFEEVGVPVGTTMVVRNLFFNTPARRKFLKSAQTEASYVSTVIEHLCMSHPEISFRFIVNGQPKIQTNGNNRLKDVIYTVFGRDAAGSLLNVDAQFDTFKVTGFLGKPELSRGNRLFENYYINGRYIKNKMITAAIEDAYSSFIMQHKYPFVALNFTIDPEFLDVNVHPQKMELRLMNGPFLYDCLTDLIKDTLLMKELIVKVEPGSDTPVKPEKEPEKTRIPEPFEVKRVESFLKSQPDRPVKPDIVYKAAEPDIICVHEDTVPYCEAPKTEPETEPEKAPEKAEKPVQLEIFTEEKKILSEENLPDIRIVGQVFDTYWIVEFNGSMYIIDQHAAHEKVLFEKFMKQYADREITTQLISPPVVISTTLKEAEALEENKELFCELGFEIADFGNGEYVISGVPAHFSDSDIVTVVHTVLDDMLEQRKKAEPEVIKDRIATMACKAAVKGNNRLSFSEAEALLKQLMSLENPYNCPHGRPTMISMSKYDLEKKFRRIV